MRKLGAVSADLAAVACFFEEPWKRLSPVLSEEDQAWLLNEAATRLRALGRLTESVEPLRTGLRRVVRMNHWGNAARSANNLGELDLTLGNVAAAVQDAEKSVAFADKIPGNWRMFIVSRTALAYTLEHAGRQADALELFRTAEALQTKREPKYPLLYSLWGLRYCDLLLAEFERLAWAAFFASSPRPVAHGRVPAYRPQALEEIQARTEQTLKWEERMPEAQLLDIALHHLALGRVALYRAILERSSFEPAHEELTIAVDGLRTAGQVQELPRGLLSRAWLRFLEGDPDGAKADLDEAWQIAERGSMKLHMADILLHRARLFRDRKALDAAAKLIEETGYHRRDGELADAREALNHPQS